MRESLAGLRRNVVTWLPDHEQPLRRTVYDESGIALFESPKPSSHGLVFDEWLEPPQRLLLFGAGDDAEPITQLASLLGWRTIVVDGRAQLARSERFPAASAVITSSELGNILPQREDAVVIMGHSYEQDRSWLTALLPYQPRYLGLLGSRHRSALLVSEAATALGWTLDQACQNLFAPVGLDLGGDGAEAIALATIAEIQACCQGKLGHSRRVTPEIVLEQIKRGGSSRYLQCAL
jgi:xanthine/CO dehydrogenase XdhC/CoxF family maturation factor